MKVKFMAMGFVGAIMENSSFVNAASKYQSLDKLPVKFAAWLSKKYQIELIYLKRAFGAMGYTRVRLWLYPFENPSGAVAIGKCVPVFIACYALKKRWNIIKV